MSYEQYFLPVINSYDLVEDLVDFDYKDEWYACKFTILWNDIVLIPSNNLIVIIYIQPKLFLCETLTPFE